MSEYIRPGQVWCHTRDYGPGEWITVRVVEVEGGRVRVVDAETGKRPRSINAASFHRTPAGRGGRPYRNGYVLETNPGSHPEWWQ